MRLPIVNGNAHPHNRKTNKSSFLYRCAKAFVTRRDKLIWDYSSLDLIYKLIVLPGDGLYKAGHTPELPGTAGLLFVGVVKIRARTNCLPIRHLRHARLHLTLILASHALNVHIQVQLPHPLDDSLVRLRIYEAAEGRIFLGEPVQRLGNLVSGPLVLRSDGKRDDRLWNKHRSHCVIQISTAKGVSRRAVHAEKRHNVSGGSLTDVFHLVRVHPYQTAHLEFLARADVKKLSPFFDSPLIYTHIGELAVFAIL